MTGVHLSRTGKSTRSKELTPSSNQIRHRIYRPGHPPPRPDTVISPACRRLPWIASCALYFVTVIVMKFDFMVPPLSSFGTARLTWIVYLSGRLRS